MIKIIWGSNQTAPNTSRSLASAISEIENIDGYLYIGYPIIGTPLGPMKCDALLVSKLFGLVAFDLVEGPVLGDYADRQDEIATLLEVKLLPFPELKIRRNLKFEINTVTFTTVAKIDVEQESETTFLANGNNLKDILRNFSWSSDESVFTSLIATIQSVTSLRSGASRRHVEKANSFGARLKGLEESIANLDQQQSEAVIESVEGVQRIRGLAGSGKTIVLALKAAYLHAQNPNWNIAVTFNTRSLKEQFKRLINNFTIEQTGIEPDWEKIHVINAWGAPGAAESSGIYYKFSSENNIAYFDYQTAKNKFGTDSAFDQVCKRALSEQQTDTITYYDLILIDEAQDFPASFLKLCYQFLKPPKRLVYAYDELQTLTGATMAPPEDIFGKTKSGQPVVTLRNDVECVGKQDIILEKCYRNSRPLLASAHALGFGIYRPEGLIQFFDQDGLWEDVGYTIMSGELSGGSNISLERTSDTSPVFLENHSTIEELIDVRVFESTQSMNDALIASIKDDIENNELKAEDVLVINPNPFTTKKIVGPIRSQLMTEGINSELAGVTTSRDVFKLQGSVTFTGIFRAKGNEAGMVYVINAQDCNTALLPNQLAIARNRLFTAITRSKSWVRVWGIGPKMQELKDEWDTLKENNFALNFTYPTEQQKSTLKLINKDLNLSERTRKMKYARYMQEISEAVKQGEISSSDIPQSLINELLKK